MPGDESIYNIKQKQKTTDQRLDTIEVKTSEVHSALLGSFTPEGKRVPGFCETIEGKLSANSKRIEDVEKTVGAWTSRIGKGFWALALGFLGTAGAAVYGFFGGKH